MNAKDLIGFAFEAAKLAGAHAPAFQALASRIGEAVGGNDQARLDSVLDEAVKARKAAGAGMHEAGKAR